MKGGITIAMTDMDMPAADRDILIKDAEDDVRKSQHAVQPRHAVAGGT